MIIIVIIMFTFIIYNLFNIMKLLIIREILHHRLTNHWKLIPSAFLYWLRLLLMTASSYFFHSYTILDSLQWRFSWFGCWKVKPFQIDSSVRSIWKWATCWGDEGKRWFPCWIDAFPWDELLKKFNYNQNVLPQLKCVLLQHSIQCLWILSHSLTQYSQYLLLYFLLYCSPSLGLNWTISGYILSLLRR